MSAPVDVRAVLFATESALVKTADGSPDALAQAALSCDARAAIAKLIEREAAYRNALEHIAGSCEGRAADVAIAALRACGGAA